MKIFRYLLSIFLVAHAYGMEPRLTPTLGPEYVDAQVKVAFVPQDNIKEELFNFLDQAKEYVFIAMYWLTDYSIIDKLIALKEKNIDVKVIVDESSFFHVDTQQEKLRLKDKISSLFPLIFPSRNTQPHYIMHNKFVVRDGEAVWTGSANFTGKAFWYQNPLKNNYENIVIIHSPEIAQKYREMFEAIRQESVALDVKQLESSEQEISSFESSQPEESVSEPPVKKLKEERGGSLHVKQKTTEELDESEEDFEEEESEGNKEFDTEDFLLELNYNPGILDDDEKAYLVDSYASDPQNVPTPRQVETLKIRNYSIEGLDKRTATQIINQISVQEDWALRR